MSEDGAVRGSKRGTWRLDADAGRLGRDAGKKLLRLREDAKENENR